MADTERSDTGRGEESAMVIYHRIGYETTGSSFWTACNALVGEVVYLDGDPLDAEACTKCLGAGGRGLAWATGRVIVGRVDPDIAAKVAAKIAADARPDAKPYRESVTEGRTRRLGEAVDLLTQARDLLDGLKVEAEGVAECSVIAARVEAMTEAGETLNCAVDALSDVIDSLEDVDFAGGL